MRKRDKNCIRDKLDINSEARLGSIEALRGCSYDIRDTRR